MTGRLAALLVTAVVLAVPGSAQADGPPRPWYPVSDPRVAQDIAIADAYWHAAPNCPQGYAVFEADLGISGDVGAADQPGCAMWLSPSVLERWTSRGAPRALLSGYDSAYLCALIVHERGHSLGYGHSPNPGDVMYAFTLNADVVPGCRAQDWTARPLRRHHRHRRPHHRRRT